MARDFDWNDLRSFLAVMRAGRLTVAAQAMGIDHTTLGRQVARLEEVLQTRLFERRPMGYVPTPAAERLLADAEAMETLVIGLRARMTDQVHGLTGAVRIGAPEGFGTSFLAPRIGYLALTHPGLEIELIANPRVVSLSKREADIAVTNYCPEEGRLHAVKLTDYELGIYASREYLLSHPAIRDRADLVDHTFIGYIGDLLPTSAHAYLPEVGRTISPRLRISNILTQRAVTEGGAGICVLPHFMCANRPELVRLLGEEIRIVREFWLIIHSDMRDLARVRTAVDFIVDAVHQERRLFLPE